VVPVHFDAVLPSTIKGVYGESKRPKIRSIGATTTGDEPFTKIGAINKTTYIDPPFDSKADYKKNWFR
jgi:hypothetical protein